MALQKEIWINSIVGNLFADNTFMGRSIDHSAFVNNLTVHVPNAGAAPTVVKGRSEFPASVGQRSDSDLNYSISEFTTDPFRISNAEEVELSYDKRENIISASRAALQEAVADELIKSWVPSGFAKVATTGDSVDAHMASATGNRKAVTKADILAVKKEFDKNNIPQEGRCMLMDYEMYNQLLSALTESQANAFLASADAQKGIVGKLYGFDIYLRSKVLRVNAAGTAITSGTTATDGAGALAWQNTCVSRAMGETSLFEREKDPAYYGDIVSALVRAGGKYVRTDKAGVVVLYQGTPA